MKSINQGKCKDQKIDFLHFLDRTINSIRYIEKENIKDMFMNFDVSLTFINQFIYIILIKAQENGYISIDDFERLLQKYDRKVIILKLKFIYKDTKRDH